VEEIHVEVDDVQLDRGLALAQRQAQAGDVVAAEDVHRRIARRVVGRRMARAAFAVQETLDVGQEGDELAVMALLELARVVGEFVVDALPGMVGLPGLENFPVPSFLRVAGQRGQLQRPHQAGVQQANRGVVLDGVG